MILNKKYTEQEKCKSLPLTLYKFYLSLAKSILKYFRLDSQQILIVTIYENSQSVREKILYNIEQLEKKGRKVRLILEIKKTAFSNSSSEDDLALNQLVDQLIQRKLL